MYSCFLFFPLTQFLDQQVDFGVRANPSGLRPDGKGRMKAMGKREECKITYKSFFFFKRQGLVL
jgi:hypothetical protein